MRVVRVWRLMVADFGCCRVLPPECGPYPDTEEDGPVPVLLADPLLAEVAAFAALAAVILPTLLW